MFTVFAFPAPEARMYLRILVVETEPEAAQMVSRLQKGESFAGLARKYSTHPSAGRGGWLGAVWLEQMNPDFQTGARSLKVGDYAASFRSAEGFVILYRMPRNFQRQAYELQLQGDKYAETGQLEKAVEAYQAAVDLYPEFIHGYFSLAVAYGKMGRFDLEAEHYLAALQIEPAYESACYNLGVLRMKRGDTAGAISAFQKALEINPELVKCYVSLSAAHQARGETDPAIEAARKATLINPLHAPAYFNLGVAQRERDREAALMNFEAAAALDPTRPDFHMAAAVTLVELGRIGAAVARLEQLLQETPDFAPARQALSNLKKVQAP